MADAIPVQRKAVDADASKKDEAPKVEAKVPAPKPGEDHPVLGRWVGSGWRKDH